MRRKISSADFIDLSPADAMIEHGILEYIGSDTRLDFAAPQP